MTLEELHTCVDTAVAAFDNIQLYPGVRASAAFDVLGSVTGHREIIPHALRGQFEELWGSFHAPGRRIEEIIKNEKRFALFTAEEIARCERLTRKFACALAAYPPPVEGEPEVSEPLPPEESPREDSSRAAAEE